MQVFRHTLGVLLLVIGLADAGHAAEPVPGDEPTVPQRPAATAKVPVRYGEAAPVPAGDAVIRATADRMGYHLFAAAAANAWHWRPLATLQPGAYAAEDWIGEHCLTGDGRHVVAVVAPWSANNKPDGLAHGALAYVIDTRTGVVRPLVSGVSLAYFNPGCGWSNTAALTAYPRKEMSQTAILTADLRTASVRADGVLPGMYTSAVPVGSDTVAVGDGRLVRVMAKGATGLAKLDGDATRLSPNRLGGLDFLAGTAGELKAWSWHPSSGMRPAGSAAAAWKASGKYSTASWRGEVGLRPDGGLVRLADQAPLGDGRLPDAARPFTALPKVAAPDAVVPPDPPDTAPTCSVPRNDSRFLVQQASDAQVEWAVQKAAKGALVGAGGGPMRASGALGLSTGSYSPSDDFRLPAPFGTGQPVPPEVIRGVLAQESNWRQASPHAPTGTPGNPYVANYYGYKSNPDTGEGMDYADADCGYGLGQITDGMRLLAGQTELDAKQQRVALDYAENVAATAKILADKWNQLRGMGIVADSGDPSDLEAWYLPVWAYNSGVNPQGSTGGTGCVPGPGCTDSDGNWGLGWTNNPANLFWDPLRHPFLHMTIVTDTGETVHLKTYDDARTPQHWPYQEKVFGWIETSQLSPADWVTLKYPPTFHYENQTGFLLQQPSRFAFCDATSRCLPLSLEPCGYSDEGPLQWHCWWHGTAQICGPGGCHRTAPVANPGNEPAIANRFPPVCQSGLPAGTVPGSCG